MQLTLDSCVVNDVFEGTSKESGRPFQILTFVDCETWHEYKIFVPERMHENVRRIPHRVAVRLYFEVSQGRNQSMALTISGWDVVS